MSKERRSLAAVVATRTLEHSFVSEGKVQSSAEPMPPIELPTEPQTLAPPSPSIPGASKKTVAAKPAVVDDALVSATFRIPDRLMKRLLRAAANRKIERQEPFSQQEIVAVALENWLLENE
jgi:hypothetical protein